MLASAFKAFVSLISMPAKLSGRTWRAEFINRYLKTLFTPNEDDDINAVRRRLSVALPHPAKRKVSTRMQKIGDTPCAIVMANDSPSQTQSSRVVLYFHGGGYVLGSTKGHSGILAEIAVESDALVVAPDYALAPEHPFPHAHDECLKLTRTVIDTYPDSAFYLAGDSAGGGLALATAQCLDKDHRARVSGLVLISPWVDPLAQQGSMINQQANDYLRLSFLNKSFDQLMQGADVNDPRVNFTQGDFSLLPPTLVHYGSAEIFRDQIQEFCARVESQAESFEYKEFANQFHDFQLFSPMIREGRESMLEIADFIKRSA